tara:strand:+ start:734 stop:1138 length:405 start_codon:yes stop_codon:yes gene_type:complete
MMGEEFHGVIKLVTGEEIFATISIDENNGDPIIMVQDPVIMKVLQNPTGQYVKVRPWLELPEDNIFLLKYEKIITMTEVKDSQMIEFYQRYLNDDSLDMEFDGRVKLNPRLGLITTVEESRRRLEEIYKINIEN